ncbi:MAG: hypothetical protein ABFS18_06330 [Thermodesulfobacteriota bacterium]
MLNKKLVLGSLAGATLLVGAAVLVPTAANAAGVVGGTCVNCHTMHDSVDGADQDATGAQAQLLKFAGCVGCHTGSANNPTTGLGSGTIPAPQVGVAASATANAGGYFDVDANSHSVDGSILTMNAVMDAPGGGGVAAFEVGTSFTCEDCHGAAIGGHHAASVSYRMLDADSANDGTWAGAYVTEGTVSPTYGQATDSTYDATTLNNFCADCHGGFHGQLIATDDQNNDAGEWIRHPTDVNASILGVNYTGTLSAIPTGLVANEVMCISCHRAHGSGELDLLRFNYSANTAGNTTATLGCETCHGAK